MGAFHIFWDRSNVYEGAYPKNLPLSASAGVGPTLLDVGALRFLTASDADEGAVWFASDAGLARKGPFCIGDEDEIDESSASMAINRIKAPGQVQRL